MLITGFALHYLALSLLALAMFGHFKEVFSRPVSTKQQVCCRLLGWGLLLLSFIYYCSELGISYGSIVFLGSLTAGALLVSMTLSFRAPSLPLLMVVSGVASLIPAVIPY